jgi:hypothetical protein
MNIAENKCAGKQEEPSGETRWIRTLREEDWRDWRDYSRWTWKDTGRGRLNEAGGYGLEY